ncbi:purine permease [Clostridium botulinum]|nr:purine permease [Clostridium botulinum]EKS4395624.1 purine permease [Clostridium botulinum]
MKNTKDTNLIVGIDEKISLRYAFFLGLQHVFAMDLYIVPIILAGILSLDAQNTAYFIQMSFIAAGIATLIQTGLCMRLPIMQGPSYIPIGALAAIGSKLGLQAMVGSLIPGSLFLMILGYPLRFLSKIISKFIPHIVGGTVIVIVGISLMPVAMTNIFTAPGNLKINCILALISSALLVSCIMIGRKSNKFGKAVRLTSVMISLIGGTIAASLLGVVDFTPVTKAAWFSFPKLLPFGKPVFDLKAILTMLFIYAVILVETSGTWFAVSAVTGSELTDEGLNRGAVGEGIGCFVGALFGGTPMTGYSTNAGIIAVTGVGSRMAIIAGGIILVALGMLPKLMNVIACIPSAVVSGVFAVVCVIIAMNGFKSIQHEEFDERNMLLIGLPILLALGTTVLPKDILNSLPSLANYIFSSGITVGALAAVILNILLPKAPVEVSKSQEYEEAV